MSTRELVFEYTTKGARSAQRADSKVRQSIRRTGKQANRQAGSVRRWAERNRDAVRMMATAMLGFAAGIASASPTLRANLGGVRAAVTLVVDQIVRDLLPAGNSLASLAIDLARWFTNLDDTVRTWLSRFAVVGTLFAAVALAAGPVISAVTTIWGVLTTLVGAFGTVVSAAGAVIGVIKLLVGVLATILGVSTTVAAGIAILIAAVVALATALIFNIGGARDKTIAFLTEIWTRGKQLLGKLWDWAKSVARGIYDALRIRLAQARNRAIVLLQSLFLGAQKRLLKLLARAREIATQVRDAVAQRITQLKERVLDLLSLAREMAARGRAWVSGLAEGVRDRAGELVGAFRDMASRVANAFRDRFNELIPSRISIPSVSISIPPILGGGSRTVGGGSLRLPQLDTGGRIASDGLAMLHAGERIMPAAQVRERGPQPTTDSGTTIEEVNITVQAMGDDPVGTGRGIAREFERELSDRGA